MDVISSRERLIKCLLGQAVDRIPFGGMWGQWGPWPQTRRRWREEGMEHDDEWYELFGFDPQLKSIPVQAGIYPYFENTLLSDEGETFVHVNEYGVVVRDRKNLDSMPQFIEHPVRDRKSWEKFKKERLQVNTPGRFPDNWKELVQKYAQRDYPLMLGGYPYGFFGMPRWLMGDERLLFALAEEPEFVLDINEHLCWLWKTLWERVLSDVQPDMLFLWEDMAGRQGSLISPAMFRRFMTPFYRELVNLVRSYNVQVIIVDSDGFIEDLGPLFWEAGINCLFPWEVQAGNLLERARQKCSGMAFMGGMDKRVMAKGRKEMDEEIARVERLLFLGRFVPFPDHLIPPDVSWGNYQYFVSRWMEMILTYVPERA